MNMHTLVFFHSENCNQHKCLCDFIDDYNIKLFCTQKLDILCYLMNKLEPSYLVIDATEFKHLDVIEDIVFAFNKTFIYIIGGNYDSCRDNVFVAENFEILKKVIGNHYRCFSTYTSLSENKRKLTDQILAKQLKQLNFSSNHIGARYLCEIVHNIVLNNTKGRNQCNCAYEKISKTYNTQKSCIERNIRNAIDKAYETSLNKCMFHKICNDIRKPTIKELANYLYDQAILV